MLLVACGTTKKSQSEEQKAVSVMFNADSAYAFCAAQCQYGPRTMNSEAHEKCGEWIAEKFRHYGCEVELQRADLKGYDGTILKRDSHRFPLQGQDSSLTAKLLHEICDVICTV